MSSNTHGSLARIQHRSRDFLKVEYYSLSNVLGPLIIGAVLIFISLFVLSSETKLICTKYHGKPSLNDVCIYQSTTILAQSGLIRAVLPTFLTGYKYYYPLKYIKDVSLFHQRQYDSESETYTDTYSLLLHQNEGIMNSLKEKENLSKFLVSSDNFYGNDYTTTKTINNYIFSSKTDDRIDSDRFISKFRSVLNQYRTHPEQPILFEWYESSWLDEILLIIGIGLVTFCLFFISVSENIILDGSTKTLLLVRKTILGFVILTEYIPFSQIINFSVDTKRSFEYVRGGGRHSPSRRIEKIYYSGILTLKEQQNNGAFIQDIEHHQVHRYDPNARRGIGPVGNEIGSAAAAAAAAAANVTENGSNGNRDGNGEQERNGHNSNDGQNDGDQNSGQNSDQNIQNGEDQNIDEVQINNDSDEFEAQSPIQNENTEYAQEAGEDGEFILLSSPRSRFESRRAPDTTNNRTTNQQQQQRQNNRTVIPPSLIAGNNNQQPLPPPPPPPPPPSQRLPSTRIIKLLNGASLGENNQAAVGEYIALFKDWLVDFKRRDELAETQREEIIRMAEATLQRQVMGMVGGRNASASAAASGNASQTNDNNEQGNRDEQQDQQQQQQQHGQEQNPDEQHQHQPQQQQTQITELTDEQINFLLRRRNRRLANPDQQTDSPNSSQNNTSIDDNGINTTPSSSSSSTAATPTGLVCCVCLDEEQPVRTVLMPCKHLILCNQCAAACDKCPLCRREIGYTMQVFF